MTGQDKPPSQPDLLPGCEFPAICVHINQNGAFGKSSSALLGKTGIWILTPEESGESPLASACTAGAVEAGAWAWQLQSLSPQDLVSALFFAVQPGSAPLI